MAEQLARTLLLLCLACYCCAAMATVSMVFQDRLGNAHIRPRAPLRYTKQGLDKGVEKADEGWGTEGVKRVHIVYMNHLGTRQRERQHQMKHIFLCFLFCLFYNVWLHCFYLWFCKTNKYLIEIYVYYSIRVLIG